MAYHILTSYGGDNRDWGRLLRDERAAFLDFVPDQSTHELLTEQLGQLRRERNKLVNVNADFRWEVAARPPTAAPDVPPSRRRTPTPKANSRRAPGFDQRRPPPWLLNEPWAPPDLTQPAQESQRPRDDRLESTAACLSQGAPGPFYLARPPVRRMPECDAPVDVDGLRRRVVPDRPSGAEETARGQASHVTAADVWRNAAPDSVQELRRRRSAAAQTTHAQNPQRPALHSRVKTEGALHGERTRERAKAADVWHEPGSLGLASLAYALAPKTAANTYVAPEEGRTVEMLQQPNLNGRQIKYKAYEKILESGKLRRDDEPPLSAPPARARTGGDDARQQGEVFSPTHTYADLLERLRERPVPGFTGRWRGNTTMPPPGSKSTSTRVPIGALPGADHLPPSKAERLHKLKLRMQAESVREAMREADEMRRPKRHSP